ncbi:MAG: hypothetical protein [Caudoviricetes sp.]|nr:MAG: hypothetical protein [Caudoviricetes sp.]
MILTYLSIPLFKFCKIIFGHASTLLATNACCVHNWLEFSIPIHCFQLFFGPRSTTVGALVYSFNFGREARGFRLNEGCKHFLVGIKLKHTHGCTRSWRSVSFQNHRAAVWETHRRQTTRLHCGAHVGQFNDVFNHVQTEGVRTCYVNVIFHLGCSP